jgi:tRNA threonylcarbamoyladenosine biosynthesis protein TsaE
MTLISRSEQETFAFGERLAQSLRVPARIFLVGDLGAGKTTLTRGIAAGFGIADPGEVSSPTFTLINKYSGRVPIYHVDLYRIGGEETHALGLDELLDDPEAVVIIEWADQLREPEPDRVCRVFLTWVDAATRRIEVSC